MANSTTTTLNLLDPVTDYFTFLSFLDFAVIEECKFNWKISEKDT